MLKKINDRKYFKESWRFCDSLHMIKPFKCTSCCEEASTCRTHNNEWNRVVCFEFVLRMKENDSPAALSSVVDKTKSMHTMAFSCSPPPHFRPRNPGARSKHLYLFIHTNERHEKVFRFFPLCRGFYYFWLSLYGMCVTAVLRNFSSKATKSLVFLIDARSRTFFYLGGCIVCVLGSEISSACGQLWDFRNKKIPPGKFNNNENVVVSKLDTRRIHLKCGK